MWKAVLVGVPAGIAGWFVANVAVAFSGQSDCQIAGTCAPASSLPDSPVPILVGLVVFALVMIAGWFLTRATPAPTAPNETSVEFRKRSGLDVSE